MNKVHRPILLKALNDYLYYQLFKIKNMTDKKELIKELIQKNPNLSGNEIYSNIKGTVLGIRRQTFQEIFRETKNLPEPTIKKREASIPKIFKTPKTVSAIKVKAKERTVERAKVEVKPTEVIEPIKKKKESIPFEKTKFGKITKDLQKAHRISEKKAIIHARKILKIDKSDYDKINKKDVQILLTHTP